MRVAGRLAGNGTQSKPLLGVEIRRLQPAIVEHQRLALAVFEEQLAVVGALDCLGHYRADLVLIAVESLEQAVLHGRVPN